MARGEGEIVFEDAELRFRNFQGKEGQYNREGDRNFCVMLADEKLIKQLDADGWNIKNLKAREEGDEDRPYLQVAVNFKGKPPRVVLITSRGRSELAEDDVALLDWIEIRTVDLIVRPYNWVVNGKSGIKAYLKSIYITMEEDYLDRKYADLNDAPHD